MSNMFTLEASAKYLALGAMVRYEKWLDGQVVNHGFSGGEANSAVAVANAGRPTVMATAIVEGHPYTPAIGRMLSRVDPASGVHLLCVEPKRFSFDGVTGHNYGRVIYELGTGPVADEAYYQRGAANREAAALLKPGDFDFESLCAQGVRWLHSGGIFACIGAQTYELIIHGMQCVRQAGGYTSFDLNVRTKLARELLRREPREVFAQIMPQVSLLFGNEEDLQTGLGIEGPAVGEKGAQFTKDDFLRMAFEVVGRYPNIQAVVSSVRLVKRREVHLWGAYMLYDRQLYVVEPEEITVVDRVGGGDACGGTLVAALMGGADPDMALKLGVAAGAACAGTWGDMLQTPYARLVKAAGGAAARIER